MNLLNYITFIRLRLENAYGDGQGIYNPLLTTPSLVIIMTTPREPFFFPDRNRSGKACTSGLHCPGY